MAIEVSVASGILPRENDVSKLKSLVAAYLGKKDEVKMPCKLTLFATKIPVPNKHNLVQSFDKPDDQGHYIYLLNEQDFLAASFSEDAPILPDADDALDVDIDDDAYVPEMDTMQENESESLCGILGKASGYGGVFSYLYLKVKWEGDVAYCEKDCAKHAYNDPANLKELQRRTKGY